MVLEALLVHVLAELDREAAGRRHLAVAVQGKREHDHRRQLGLLGGRGRGGGVGGGLGRRAEGHLQGLQIGDPTDRGRPPHHVQPLPGVALQLRVEGPPVALRLAPAHPDRVEVVLDHPVRGVALAARGEVAVEVLAPELPHYVHDLVVVLAGPAEQLLEAHELRLHVLGQLLVRRPQIRPEDDVVVDLHGRLVGALAEDAGDLDLLAVPALRLLLPLELHLRDRVEQDVAAEGSPQGGADLPADVRDLEHAVRAHRAADVGGGGADEVVDARVDGLAVLRLVPVVAVLGARGSGRPCQQGEHEDRGTEPTRHTRV